MRTLVWFRGKDLRISDHAPLVEAIEQGEVITLFNLDPFFFEPDQARELPHRLQFLLGSLGALKKNVEAKGGELLLCRGPSHEVIPRLARRWKVDRVVAHRWTEPFARWRDARIRAELDVPFDLYEGETLLPPETVRNKSGDPYAVYTPFARAARELLEPPAEIAPPKKLPRPPEDLDRAGLVQDLPSLSDCGLEHNSRILEPGERAANKRLQGFCGRIENYKEGRDQLAEEATSRLSQDLKFGLVSPRQVFRMIKKLPASKSRDHFLSELLWREFAYATLWDRPELSFEPFRPEFSQFPYSGGDELFEAWWKGETGYPVVDASARQLLQEGYVHNRARMISASFLTKHLLVHYRRGEAHYLKYLTDGDWAINNMGWQWSAGCGVDAQPYFRVFNPFGQGEKFDPEGAYVRKYLPELERLPNKYVHQPWTAPASVLKEAGIRLGKDYPEPIVDHKEARERFLELAKTSLKK